MTTAEQARKELVRIAIGSYFGGGGVPADRVERAVDALLRHPETLARALDVNGKGMAMNALGSLLASTMDDEYDNDNCEQAQ